MKTYSATLGFRKNSNGAGTVMVNGGGTERPLRHRVRHSPTGFAWGYGGSGPSDLARSILWDALGFAPAPSLYQEFKRTFIEPLHQEQGFVIEEGDIRAWLAEVRPGSLTPETVGEETYA